MSLGEMTNLYREGELVFQPGYQRLYRWSDLQKSRLVESILLGIPIPSIFVAQVSDGRWELVDGVQRIGTILELQGELTNEATGERLPELTLRETPYLRGLSGVTWSTLPESLRLDIKRSKFDLKILKRESDPRTKLDLFQRLNAYGSPLSAQEVRSAMLYAVDPEFVTWVEFLAELPSFQQTTSLSERLTEERYPVELVLRFLVLHDKPADRLTVRALRDFPEVLNKESISLAGAPEKRARLERVFRTTFDFLSQTGGDDVFRKWDEDAHQFRGSFLNSAFEVFALGAGYWIARDRSIPPVVVRSAIEKFWSDRQVGFATGRPTQDRLAEFVPLGRKLLTPN